jgi:hypothetical protein
VGWLLVPLLQHKVRRNSQSNPCERAIVLQLLMAWQQTACAPGVNLLMALHTAAVVLTCARLPAHSLLVCPLF